VNDKNELYEKKNMRKVYEEEERGNAIFVV